MNDIVRPATIREDGGADPLTTERRTTMQSYLVTLALADGLARAYVTIATSHEDAIIDVMLQRRRANGREFPADYAPFKQISVFALPIEDGAVIRAMAINLRSIEGKGKLSGLLYEVEFVHWPLEQRAIEEAPLSDEEAAYLRGEDVFGEDVPTAVEAEWDSLGYQLGFIAHVMKEVLK